MPGNDTRDFDASDVPAAIGLLTRLPVKVDMDKAQQRGARAAWAYPLAGLVIAVFAGLLAEVLLRLGTPAPLVAALVLGLSVVLTGAMHEDGLADSADGLWGGWTRERRLEIMKDSHIGAYGVIALVLGLLIRWAALSMVIESHLWLALVISAVLSRAGMTALMAWLPNARVGGLSHSVGRPQLVHAVVAGVIAVGIAFALAPGLAPVLSLLTAATVLGCALVAKAKINGQTGDILGATQQLSEIVVLIGLATLLA